MAMCEVKKLRGKIYHSSTQILHHLKVTLFNISELNIQLRNAYLRTFADIYSR